MSLSVPQSLPETIRRLAERIGPSVVGVNHRGSGIVVSDGLVLTNAHNLNGPGPEIVFADGRRESGVLLGADIDGDLALVRTDTSGVTGIEDGTEQVEVGDYVFGISRPGGRTLRVTVGNVSSSDRSFRGPRGRRIEGGIEHTSPLPRGSSGGPIVDAGGRLVGLNTHRVEDGFYLALPSGDALRRFIAKASAGDITPRRSLGVAVVPPAAAGRMRLAVGLSPIDAPLVRGVEEGGPAARAGMRRGDVIIGADGVNISTVDDLYRSLDAAGDALRLKVVRGDDELEVLVEFESAPGGGGEA